MPQAYATYQSYRDAWANAFNADARIPLNLDIELTTVCNLQCPFCFTTDQKFKRMAKQGFMEPDLAIFLIDYAANVGIPALKFNWRGESTLHQNFTHILKYAREKNAFHDILINTNGNVPDHALRGLLYATKIVVSLDAFGKNLYAIMRTRGDIRTVIDTVNYLVERGHKNVWVRRVITKDNKHEPYYSIAKALWDDKVKIAEHYCFDRTNVTDLKKQNQAKRKYCGYPSQRLVVATDGSVFPCCVDYYQTMLLGKVPKDDLLGIWRNSKNLIALRKNLRSNHIDELMPQCMNCTSYMAYDVAEREKVQDKEINNAVSYM